MKSAKENAKEKKKQKIALQKKYGQRITIARQAREAFLQKDYISAQRKYYEYLGILSELNDIDDIFKLSPSMFDNKREVTEMLLVSHVYWEVARINETSPQLEKVFARALSQFVKFTVNQPYQVLNAEMLRKYIKKNRKVTQKYGQLNAAYQQIFVQSKKCYIATHCLGATSPWTQTLRQFKLWLLETPGGIHFVRFYYLFSPKLIRFLEAHPGLDRIIQPLFAVSLKGFASILKSSILKR